MWWLAAYIVCTTLNGKLEQKKECYGVKKKKEL